VTQFSSTQYQPSTAKRVDRSSSTAAKCRYFPDECGARASIVAYTSYRRNDPLVARLDTRESCPWREIPLAEGAAR